MKSYTELVNILGSNGVQCVENGITHTYKKNPDSDAGVLDTRETMVATVDKDTLRREPEKYHQNLVDNYNYLFPIITEADSYTFRGIQIGVMRKGMGWNNIDMTTNIVTECREVGDQTKVPIRIYYPNIIAKNRPCLIFFHGGGFIGGSLDVVENPCKAIAEKADAVVISVDYRLAPEYPFPAGFEDCYAVVQWAWEQAGRIGIDSSKIGVAGDSAGGNLAAACTLRDRDEGGGRIHYQALLYATLMRGEPEEYPDYHWNMDIYNNKQNNPYIERACTWIKEAGDMINITYVQDGNRHNPYISPMDADNFSGLPRTLVATAEYDYLRVECDLYSKYLTDAGCTVRNIRYGGVGHAYLDKYGFYPQAEDCVNEIVRDLQQL